MTEQSDPHIEAARAAQRLLDDLEKPGRISDQDAELTKNVREARDQQLQIAQEEAKNKR